MKPIHGQDQFIKQLIDWASTQNDIKAIALVGSRARMTADQDSDIDLILIVKDPKFFLDDISWVNQFGPVAGSQIEHYGKVTSVRVWYSSSLEVEYGITDQSWAEHPLDSGSQKVIDDGMIVLFERTPIISIYNKG
jgi:predicted nucleotidyltransferase